jgi:hypothetical protein
LPFFKARLPSDSQNTIGFGRETNRERGRKRKKERERERESRRCFSSSSPVIPSGVLLYSLAFIAPASFPFWNRQGRERQKERRKAEEQGERQREREREKENERGEEEGNAVFCTPQKMFYTCPSPKPKPQATRREGKETRESD